jgi:hypothetical protein
MFGRPEITTRRLFVEIASMLATLLTLSFWVLK